MPPDAVDATGHSGADARRGGSDHRGDMLRVAALGAGLTLVYILSALVGFRLAFVAEQITTVWAPTGIAIAALLLWGIRLWPAVWLGAFLANAASDAPLWTAFFLAAGNALEAVAATWALRQIAEFDDRFRRVTDSIAFISIAALACTTISATVGVVTLCTAGVQPWDRFATLWLDWWLGDTLGALIVAPAILTTVRPSWSRRASLEASLFVAGTLIVTHLVFGQSLGLSGHPLEYVVFPLVIAAAVHSGPAVTSLVVFSASAVTIWHTVQGTGPFAGPEIHSSLILLQVFMGVLAGTALLLAAAIAERKTSERREKDAARVLRRREEMLTLAQRAGGVATFEWDIPNQIAHCSAEFFRIFGLPARDGVMTPAEWEVFVHPDDREQMAAHLASAIRGGEQTTADYRIVAADGHIRWLSYAGQLQKTPDGNRMIGTLVDITQRKRLEADLRHHAAEVERVLESRVEAEAALRESQNVLSLAMRGGSMGAWSRNLITNEVWWSRELEEIFGLQPGAFSRTEAGFFEFVHEDDRRVLRAVVDEAVDNGSDYIVEFRFKHAGGEWRWMEGRGRAVYADNARPRTLYGIGIDVTERKRAEILLQQAKNAAETANHLKDQFLATLSHELRTPLNAILGYARLLQTNAIAQEKRDQAIDVIERNAVAQNQLIEDLLDMSRITTGKVRLDLEPVPAVTPLQNAVEGVKPAADARGIELRPDLDLFAGTVAADTARLQQVFSNLLTNAVKFTEPGGRVVASLRRDGTCVEVAVTDTGVGISPEFLPFVFEPFRQADTHLHRGLGLGLAISKQLVDLHGGTIHAMSEGLGRGATFIVRLPRVTDEAIGVIDEPITGTRPTADARSPRTASPLRGLHILLVDDEADTLTMFRETLERAGANVRAAASPIDAIRELDGWNPDLLVTDIGLPGMDGYELLRTIRGQMSRPLPAVAVTAYARMDDRSRAVSAGFQAHLSKPVDPAVLIGALVDVISSN